MKSSEKYDLSAYVDDYIEELLMLLEDPQVSTFPEENIISLYYKSYIVHFPNKQFFRWMLFLAHIWTCIIPAKISGLQCHHFCLQQPQ